MYQKQNIQDFSIVLGKSINFTMNDNNSIFVECIILLENTLSNFEKEILS